MFSDAMDLEFMGHYFGKKKKIAGFNHDFSLNFQLIW